MLVVTCDAVEELFESEGLFANWGDNEISLVKGKVHGRAVVDVSFFCVGLWDAKGKAVAPFLNSCDHGYTMTLPRAQVKSVSRAGANFLSRRISMKPPLEESRHDGCEGN